MIKKIGLLSILMCTFINVSYAKKLEIVHEHSKIGFNINYMMVTDVEGTFKKYQGDFEINDAENALSNIQVNVETKSVDSNDKKRDFHLKGHEFFYSAKFPQATFKANGPVTIAPHKEFRVEGTMTFRDVSKPFTFTGTYKGKQKDPWGKDNYFFELKGTMNRKDYGIVWNKVMDNGGALIGDDVHLVITIQAQTKGEKTPFSTHMVPETKGIKERKELMQGKRKELSTSTEIEVKTGN